MANGYTHITLNQPVIDPLWDVKIDEAVVQYGVERVARGLKLSVDTSSMSRGSDILRHVTGAKTKEEASIVFSRFLSYLSYVEYPGSSEPMPEMSWFTVG